MKVKIIIFGALILSGSFGAAYALLDKSNVPNTSPVTNVTSNIPEVPQSLVSATPQSSGTTGQKSVQTQSHNSKKVPDPVLPQVPNIGNVPSPPAQQYRNPYAYTCKDYPVQDSSFTRQVCGYPGVPQGQTCTPIYLDGGATGLYTCHY